jgi:hypothetical protein
MRSTREISQRCEILRDRCAWRSRSDANSSEIAADHTLHSALPSQHRGVMQTEHGHTHPTGTLAIIVIYALLFVGGWIAMYLFVFLSRGRVTP